MWAIRTPSVAEIIYIRSKYPQSRSETDSDRVDDRTDRDGHPQTGYRHQ
ncbi:hypothetical protein NJ7G_1275 [Natrinema sp. J7-2]|nr:hypothetical protein NJ7G_1275 [Natrinema sp. J7-2]